MKVSLICNPLKSGADFKALGEPTQPLQFVSHCCLNNCLMIVCQSHKLYPHSALLLAFKVYVLTLQAAQKYMCKSLCYKTNGIPHLVQTNWFVSIRYIALQHIIRVAMLPTQLVHLLATLYQLQFYTVSKIPYKSMPVYTYT